MSVVPSDHTDAQELLAQQVFGVLADGASHSAEQLASLHSVSPGAIRQAVSALKDLGLSIEAAPQHGYKLPAPLSPLDAARIERQLSPALRERLRYGEVRWMLPSTNSELLGNAAPPIGEFDFLLAEHQSAGRGRRARPWFAPPGGALCLSIGWSYAALPRGVSALSLAVGVCALRALRAHANLSVQLKWPNDLIARGRKLGGILIESRTESAGAAHVVIGVGINCALGAALTSRVQDSGTEATDLMALGALALDRNHLAASLLSEILSGVMEFERSGLASFAAEWSEADALIGRTVRLSLPDAECIGVARGIDADGALCVEVDGAVRGFHSGDVSVRAT